MTRRRRAARSAPHEASRALDGADSLARRAAPRDAQLPQVAVRADVGGVVRASCSSHCACFSLHRDRARADASPRAFRRGRSRCFAHRGRLRDPAVVRLLSRARSVRRVPVRARRNQVPRDAHARATGRCSSASRCFLIVTPFFYSQSLLVGAGRAAGAGRPRRSSLQVLARPALARPAARGVARAAAFDSARLFAQGIPLALVLFVFFPAPRRPAVGPARRCRRAVGPVGSDGARHDQRAFARPMRWRFAWSSTDAVPPPSQRYWRGPVLSHFDGREWSALDRRRAANAARRGPHRLLPDHARAALETVALRARDASERAARRCRHRCA